MRGSEGKGMLSGRQHSLLLLPVLVCTLLVPRPATASPQAEAVEYAPQLVDDWSVSTPAAEGLDPLLVAQLYDRARRVETLHGLLLVKNGRLIAEGYFHGETMGNAIRVQSVTKSVTSALVGIALDQGYLSGVDQKMMESFPELASKVSDPRKNRITIRDLLQMRAGYPWEESTPELFKILYHGFQPSLLVDIPLVREPGTGFEYSNLSSHLLAIIVARATGKDLLTFAEENLFHPLGIQPGGWIQDWEGYYNGHADLYLTARDMARFGQLYLDRGAYRGTRILSAEWIQDSLRTYSENAWAYRVGRNVADMGYGYQWWSARAGHRRYHFAWGHGGQQIALVDDLRLVIVVTADPLWGEHGGSSWRKEKANLNLVGDFVASLPME